MDGIAESRPDMNIKVAAYTVTHLPNYTCWDPWLRFADSLKCMMGHAPEHLSARGYSPFLTSDGSNIGRFYIVARER